MEQDSNAPAVSEGPPAGAPAFDNYRSQRDPDVMIFVKHDDVPPFRFKAGGWEQLQTSMRLGHAMIARIDEAGFFMCQLTEDQSTWTELTDLPTTDEIGLKANAK